MALSFTNLEVFKQDWNRSCNWASACLAAILVAAASRTAARASSWSGADVDPVDGSAIALLEPAGPARQGVAVLCTRGVRPRSCQSSPARTWAWALSCRHPRKRRAPPWDQGTTSQPSSAKARPRPSPREQFQQSCGPDRATMELILGDEVASSCNPVWRSTEPAAVMWEPSLRRGGVSHHASVDDRSDLPAQRLGDAL